MSDRNYESVNNDMGDQWTPQANEKNNFAYNPNNDADNIMEGYYIEIREDVGKHNATIYKIQEIEKDGKEGGKYSLWGDTVLNDLMERVAVGSFVMVKYKGRKHKKGCPPTEAVNKGNSYHVWDVGVDKNAIPYKGKVASPAPAAAATPAAQQAEAPAQSSRKRASEAPAQGDSGSPQNAPIDDDLPF